ncbi:MAG: tetratricopeptide repeat protein [Deltaproteobacteria bacterium]|nr:tetratricopeptide repeat protein [Deltaproteobacteria bacterium]
MNRKEVKSRDLFLAWEHRIMHHLMENSRVYGLFLLIVVVATLSVGFWIKNQNQKEKLASEAYYTALKAQEGKPDFKKLEEVSKEYSSTVSAVLASLKEGNLFYEKKDFKQALEVFKNTEKHTKNTFLKTLVYYNLAYTSESLNQYEGAFQYFTRLLTSEIEFLSHSGFVGQARCLEKLGKKDEALKVYEDLKKKFPKYQKQADDLIQLLNS